MLSASQKVLPSIPCNNELLAYVRESLKEEGNPLDSMRGVLVVRRFLDQAERLEAVSSDELPGTIRELIASAPQEAPQETAEAIKAHTIANFLNSINFIITGARPIIIALIEQLSTVQKQSSSRNGQSALEAGAAMRVTLEALEKSPLTSLRKAREVLTQLTEFEKECHNHLNESSIKDAKLREVSTFYIQRLEAHCESEHRIKQEEQIATLPARDSQEYRNALLAIDVYEASRKDRKHTPARHVGLRQESPESSQSADSMYRAIPPAHSIQIETISQTLAAIVDDKELAATIATTYKEMATWFQNTLPRVQALLGLDQNDFVTLLHSWHLAELEEALSNATSYHYPHQLLPKLFAIGGNSVESHEEIMQLIRDAGHYIHDLSPLERYLPEISPNLSPDNFISSHGFQMAQELRERSRRGDFSVKASHRIAAENAISELLTPYLKESAQDAARLLVYTFSEQPPLTNTPPSLAVFLREKILRHSDYKELGLFSKLAKAEKVNVKLTGVCRALEDLSLIKVFRPKEIKTMDVREALEVVTVTLAEHQKTMPTENWDMIVGLIKSVTGPSTVMSSLLARIPDLKKNNSVRQKKKTSGPRKTKTGQSLNDIYKTLSELEDLLKDINPAEEAYQLRRNLSRISTKVGIASRIVGNTDGTVSTEEACKLLNLVKPPHRVEESIVKDYLSTALSALTAATNLLKNNQGER